MRGKAHKEATFGVIVSGSKKNRKFSVDVPWDGEAARFVDVIGAVVLYMEAARQISADVA